MLQGLFDANYKFISDEVESCSNVLVEDVAYLIKEYLMRQFSAPNLSHE